MVFPDVDIAFETSITIEERAAMLRAAIIRVHAISGNSHLGGSLSLVEILTVLLAKTLDTHRWSQDSVCGDRLILSKGHAALALYCAYTNIGILDPELLRSFGRDESALEPHPNEKTLPCLHASTGSLGQGLSIGLGLAYGSRAAGRSHERVAVVLGDGELNEGQIWEAAQAASKLRLGSLIAIVDANGLQQDGPMDRIMPVVDIAASFASFGWQVAEVNGHDVSALSAVFETLLPARDGNCEGAPSLVIARTVKGFGVPHLENQTVSHYPPPFSQDDLELISWMSNKERPR